jgi:hypothetical protein
MKLMVWFSVVMFLDRPSGPKIASAIAVSAQAINVWPQTVSRPRDGIQYVSAHENAP